MTTLLPHLSGRNVQEYRWALLGGLALILLLYALGFITAAIIVAAVLVPVVYVMYLYEVSVWRDAPYAVFGLTIGAGFVLGIVATVVLDLVFGRLVPLGDPLAGGGPDLGRLAVPALLLPIIKEAIKPLPALLLRERFPDRLDGLVFGVAAGLGYAAAETIVHFSQVIAVLPIRTEPANWIYPLITIAVLAPLLHGSATGAITGALWGIGRGRLPRFAVPAIGAAVLAHILFIAGSRLIGDAALSPLLVIAWQLIVVGGLLVFVRLQLQRALVEEAASMGVERTTCSNCGSDVAAAGFCPVCGMALAAGPRDRRAARRDIEVSEGA